VPILFYSVIDLSKIGYGRLTCLKYVKKYSSYQWIIENLTYYKKILMSSLNVVIYY